MKKNNRIIILSVVIVLLGFNNSYAIAVGNLVCDSTGCSAGYADRVMAFSFGKIVTVAKNGGDYHDPFDAMDNIDAWCPSRTAASPCMVKIMPGEYDIGTNTIRMVPYVDIEGSGENVTSITGSVDSTDAGVVNGASNAGIRNLTVSNTSAGAQVVGIYNADSSPVIRQVTVSAAGGDGGNVYAIYNVGGSSPSIINVTASASHGTDAKGIYNYQNSSPTIRSSRVSVSSSSNAVGIHVRDGCSPVIESADITVSGSVTSTGVLVDNVDSASTTTVRDSNITVSGGESFGVFADGDETINNNTIKLENSRVKADTNTVVSEGIIYVTNSRLEGGAPIVKEALTCVRAYNGAYLLLDVQCQ